MATAKNRTWQQPDEKVEYVLPSNQSLDKFASAVCNELCGQPAPTNDIQGFRSFMQVVAQIMVKHKNKGKEVCPR